jgi:hypothetical protein
LADERGRAPDYGRENELPRNDERTTTTTNERPFDSRHNGWRSLRAGDERATTNERRDDDERRKTTNDDERRRTNEETVDAEAPTFGGF